MRYHKINGLISLSGIDYQMYLKWKTDRRLEISQPGYSTDLHTSDCNGVTRPLRAGQVSRIGPRYRARSAHRTLRKQDGYRQLPWKRSCPPRWRRPPQYATMPASEHIILMWGRVAACALLSISICEAEENDMLSGLAAPLSRHSLLTGHHGSLSLQEYRGRPQVCHDLDNGT